MSGSTWTWIGGTINVDSPSDWTLTGGPGNASGIPQAGDTAINNGTLVGYGLIAASLINNGVVEASNNSVPGSSTGGDLEIQGAVSGTGAMIIEPGATLKIDGALGAGQSTAFSAGAPEKLVLGSPSAITNNTITGFALGDQLEFSNGAVVTGSALVNSGTTSIPYSRNGTIGTYQFTNLQYAAGTAFSFAFPRDFATGAWGVALTRFFTWTGSGSDTAFGDGANWNFGGVAPGALDYVIFSSSGGTISGSGSVFILDFRSVGSWRLAPNTTLSDTDSLNLGQNGTGDTSLSVGNSTTISSAGFIQVAPTSGNEDLLSITGGGVVRHTGPGVTSTYAMSIGNAGASGTLAPADGMVLVSGAGSLLDLGANGLMVAGNGGTGVLTVQQGGTVNAASPNTSLLASVSIANSAGNGAILVTGTGSVLNASGYFLDGRGGTGSLTIQNNASVVVSDAPLNGSGIGIGAGAGAGPSSPSNVGGNGIAVVTTDGVLDLNSTVSGITVGGNGVNGALTVNNNGTVLAGTSMTVGTATSASGTIYGGTGELDIGAGGVVRVNNPIAANGYDVSIGSANSTIGTSTAGTATGSDSGQVVVSGTGALLDANGRGIAVGWLSNGSLLVSQGGTVLAGSQDEALGSALSIGRRSTGSVTITDPGSNITADGVVNVGRAGDGSLTVENHGTLTSLTDTTGVAGIDIGGPGVGGVSTSNGVTYTMVGGSGSALVTGSGYMFSLQTINVGTGGTDGTLTVDQGGTAEAGTQIIIGNSVSVAAGDTIFNPVGSIISSGTVIGTTGVLNVAPGGVPKADGSGVAAGTPTMVIGADADAVGELNVSGTGALVTNNGGFVVGSSGRGSLLIQGGASVVTSAGATIATNAGSDGSNANVTGAGSDWQITGALAVGDAASGSLNLTASGRVSAVSLEAGVQADSDGVVSVTDTNTTLTTTGLLAVGEAGAGELSVLNGASVGVGGDLDVGQLAGGSGNVDIENAMLTVSGNLNLGQGGGAGVLTVGTGATLTVTGGLIGGPDSQLNEFGKVDPNFDDGVNANVGVSGTQDFPGYIDGFASFTIDAGVTLTLESPSISDGTAFVLGGRRDTMGDTLVLNAGSVSADSTVTFSNTHGTLVLGTNALSSIDIQANDTAAATFVPNSNLGMATIDQFQATIDTFKAGDQIVVDTTGVATFSQDGAVVNVIQHGHTLGTLTFDTEAHALLAATTSGALEDNAVCFLPNTLIGTPRGEVPVERLAVGDLVRTLRGKARPIMWIGTGRVLATRGQRSAATPVIVRKGALAENVPHHDLRVTKGHSIYLDDVLIPVEFLVSHRSIVWDDRAQEVEIYHIELETHDVLIANGAPAESYRDDGNRWLFQNGNVGWELAPKPPCTPVLTGGEAVDAVWLRLLERAGPRRNVPLTDDPDLHLVVDGKRLDAITRREATVAFRLPRRPRSVRIRSRSAVPQELGFARDARLLGVALRRIVLAQARQQRNMGADAASLVEGFHAFEPANDIRWTDGDAAVPAELFAGMSGPTMLILHLGGATQYLDDGTAVKAA